MEPFIGEIRMFTGNYAPRDWAICAGQLIAISQNQVLFAIIGTRYGGDGRTTFGLPDLRSRVPIGNGRGPGLTEQFLGRMTGTEIVKLQSQQMPGHKHAITNSSSTATSGLTVGGTATLKCNANTPSSSTPEGNFPATTGRGGDNIYASSDSASMNANAIDLDLNVEGDVAVDVTSICGTTGESQPHTNMQPTLCVNFIIALEGIFPPRS